MPAWLIETFASVMLTRVFWFVTLMTAPVWIAMIFFPKKSLVRAVCQPLGAPLAFVFVWAYLCYQAWTLGLPSPGGTSFKESRDLATHPMVFLAGWCQFQVLQVFLGTWVYQDALKRKIAAPAELLACWIFGPLGLLIYAIRLLLGRVAKK